MSRTKIVAILAGLGIAGLVAASAATLGGLNTDNLGANVQVVASCDTDGVTATFNTDYEATVVPADPDGDGGYVVKSVDLAGISANCNGQALDLTLADGDGLQLGTGTVPSIDDLTETVTITPTNVSAVAVENIAVVITGTPTTTVAP